MAKRNLYERLTRLEEQKRSAPDGPAIDEAMRARYWERHHALCARRAALLEGRKALPPRQQLAYLRHECRAADSKADALDSFQQILRWWRNLEARKLETAILEHEGLATVEQLEALRAARPGFLEPFGPLPVPLNVEPVEDEALAEVEREIAAWNAEHKAVIAFERRQRPDAGSYRRLRESLNETGKLCIERAEALEMSAPSAIGAGPRAE